MGSPKPPGLPMGACRSLIVSARFAGPATVSLDAYWPALLDGLLAAAVQQGKRPTQTVALPLTYDTRDVGSQWHWLATTGVPAGTVADRAAGWNSRWERDPAPEPVTCSGLVWRAVGDAGGVRDLVARLPQLGNRDHHAAVVAWDVEDAGEPSRAWCTWLASGYIARPVAARAAAGLGVPDAETVDGAVRPPYWRPPPVTEGGTFAREWRPVIAPLDQASCHAGRVTKQPPPPLPTPLDVPAVAARLNVERDTVWKWRTRKLLPPEDGTVSGAPWWWPETIDAWAKATGRHVNE